MSFQLRFFFLTHLNESQTFKYGNPTLSECISVANQIQPEAHVNL